MSKSTDMRSVEHPQGPQAGRLYATPEAARANIDNLPPAVVIRLEDHEARLQDPEIIADRERRAELVANGGRVITMAEYVRQREEGLRN